MVQEMKDCWWGREKYSKRKGRVRAQIEPRRNGVSKKSGPCTTGVALVCLLDGGTGTGGGLFGNNFLCVTQIAKYKRQVPCCIHERKEYGSRPDDHLDYLHIQIPNTAGASMITRSVTERFDVSDGRWLPGHFPPQIHTLPFTSTVFTLFGPKNFPLLLIYHSAEPHRSLRLVAVTEQLQKPASGSTSHPVKHTLAR